MQQNMVKGMEEHLEVLMKRYEQAKRFAPLFRANLFFCLHQQAVFVYYSIPYFAQMLNLREYPQAVSLIGKICYSDSEGRGYRIQSGVLQPAINGTSPSLASLGHCKQWLSLVGQARPYPAMPCFARGCGIFLLGNQNSLRVGHTWYSHRC